MSFSRIDELVNQYRQGNLSRRSFVRRATALGLSATTAATLIHQAGAQDASPESSPAATGALGNDITLEEYNAQVKEAFPFEEPQNTGGQIIYGQTTDIATLNSVLVDDLYSSQIVGLVFEGLLGGSVLDGQPVPALAESWEISEDGLTYTLHLRQDVFWHDGEQFDADDVIATYDGALHPDSLSPRVGTIQGAVESYRKIDQFTVEFKALAKIRTFLSDGLSQFAILPEHIWGSIPPGEWPNHPAATGQDPSKVIGTGPFKFKEWIPSDHVTVTKNADYWDPENVPVIDEFIFRVIPESSANVQALITGEIDFIESTPPAQAETLKENQDLNVVDFDTFSFNYFCLNEDPAKSTLFVDIPVRQAMMYALDRDLIVEAIYFSYGTKADGTQPTLSFAYAPDRINTLYNYDPDKARQLLADAGWVDSDGDGIVEKDGQKLSFEIFFSEGVARYEQQIPYMQQAWKEVGIEGFPSAVPFQTLSDNAKNGTFQCCVWGFSWDATGSQDAMFGSMNLPPAGFNSMRYSNAEFDALIPKEKQALDPEVAREYLIEQANIVNDEAAAGIMVFSKDINASRKWLHNFFPNGYGLLWSINQAWVEAR